MRGSPRSASAAMAPSIVELLREGVGPPLQVGSHLFGREQQQIRESGRELRELLLGRGEHLLQPGAGDLTPRIGDFVHGPLGVLLIAPGLADRDQPVAIESLDRAVEARTLPDVDDLLLAPVPDQPLDAVRVQRLVVQQSQDGSGRGELRGADVVMDSILAPE